METNQKKPLLFVTGAFVSHTCWDAWVDYFEDKGYSPVVPPWPFKGDSPQLLRLKHPDLIELADLTLAELIDYYANIAKGFSEKPVIIGHSLGGLIAQVLINRDLGTAGVAIHPIPPQGVIPYEFTFLKNGWKVLGIFTSMKKTYLMSFKTFQRAFVNGMPFAQQQEAYEKYAIPESKRVARGGLTSAAAVDFNKAHVPLLITSGSIDQLLPPHMNIRNFKAYKQNGSVTEYKEFEGRNHGALTQPGWESDADYILQWLKAKA